MMETQVVFSARINKVKVGAGLAATAGVVVVLFATGELPLVGFAAGLFEALVEASVEDAEASALGEDDGAVAADKVGAALIVVGRVVPDEMVPAERVPADNVPVDDAVPSFSGTELVEVDGCVGVDVGAEAVAGSGVCDGDGCDADTECDAGS